MLRYRMTLRSLDVVDIHPFHLKSLTKRKSERLESLGTSPSFCYLRFWGRGSTPHGVTGAVCTILILYPVQLFIPLRNTRIVDVCRNYPKFQVQVRVQEWFASIHLSNSLWSAARYRMPPPHYVVGIVILLTQFSFWPTGSESYRLFLVHMGGVHL